MAGVLAAEEPVAERVVEWPGGAIRMTAYLSDPSALPDELVSSIRCIVRVGDRIVLCTNADGHSHPWPGGRREPGESWLATATREVHEETGWLLDPDSLRTLGWLHLDDRRGLPDDHPYPHPDLIWVVVTAEASTRAGGADWTDTEGYELASELVTLEDAVERLGRTDGLARTYLELLANG